jgi:hypothetical protein
MTDSGKPNLEDRIDRYARRELNAEEARELAQASLESPELFEDLTWSAVSATGVPSSKVVRFPRRTWFIAGAAAAALLLISFYTIRPILSRKAPAITANSQLKPALPSSARPGQPILLATGMDPVRPGSTMFRSPSGDSRAPRPTGSIVLFEDGVPTINLGSLDYLVKGSELQMFRDERSTQPIGRMVVTTVFRERARGRILGGQPVPVGSEVRVAGAVYLGALMEQVDALQGQGDLPGARGKAEEAERWAETGDVSPADKSKALEKLAALEYQAGLIQAADKHYQSAADRFDTAAAWNSLAAVRLSIGDYAGASVPLSQAVSKSPKTDIIYALSLNNSGVLAELLGDHRKAELFYTDALQALTITNLPSQDRQAVEANLTRIKSLQ